MADTELDIPAYNPPGPSDPAGLPMKTRLIAWGVFSSIVVSAIAIQVASDNSNYRSLPKRQAAERSNEPTAARQPGAAKQNLLTMREANAAADGFESALADAKNLRIAITSFQVDAIDGHLNVFVRPELATAPPNVQNQILEPISDAWKAYVRVQEKKYSTSVLFIGKDWSRTID